MRGERFMKSYLNYITIRKIIHRFIITICNSDISCDGILINTSLTMIMLLKLILYDIV
jgi:hypothetical protein